METDILEMLANICGDDAVRSEPDLDLYAEGLLDSLALVELLERLEDAFNLEINPTAVERSAFGTPGKILALVKRLQNERNQ